MAIQVLEIFVNQPENFVADYRVSYDTEINVGDRGISCTEDHEPCTIERVLWGAEIDREELDRLLVEHQWSSPAPTERK